MFPNETLCVVKFSNDGTVKTWESIPTDVPKICVQEMVRNFMASVSISSAVSLTKRSDVAEDANASLRMNEKATFISCPDETTMLSIPVESSLHEWLGIIGKPFDGHEDPDYFLIRSLQEVSEHLILGEPEEWGKTIALFQLIRKNITSDNWWGRSRRFQAIRTALSSLRSAYGGGTFPADTCNPLEVSEPENIFQKQATVLHDVVVKLRGCESFSMCVFSSQKCNKFRYNMRSQTLVSAMWYHTYVLNLAGRRSKTLVHERTSDGTNRIWYTRGGVVLLIQLLASADSFQVIPEILTQTANDLLKAVVME